MRSPPSSSRGHLVPARPICPDETARFTKDAVASHFGPVFKDDVFERYDTTLQALSNALDVRDSETEGHSRRVVEYMELIIGQLSVPAEHLAMLRRGALLHDIGKIGVPGNVLRKPAALSDAEWVLMKRHPGHGARIISRTPFLEGVSRIARHHHERSDGRGYPDGLAGKRSRSARGSSPSGTASTP